MTDRKSRKVLIINNIKSDTIDQAIFILKTNTPEKSTKRLDMNIASEAQNIIDSYIRQVERIKGGCGVDTSKTKKGTAFSPWPLLFFLTSILCVALSIALIYFSG